MPPVGTRQELVSIIEDKLLTPVYQPIFNLEQGQHYGYEALIRGPVDSPLHAPVNLFETAHQQHLLSELEFACRETSCKSFSRLGGKGKLFINVSPISLVEPNYQHGMTHKILQRTGLSPDRIVIELSEQYPLNDYELIKQATLHYREMGFEIAIDDLGAGYSGLRVWEEIRPEYVKIDQHFIENIDTDKAKQEFVRSIQKIAEQLACKVVAEGIETLEQLLMVRQLGISFAQGYYLGRPAQHLNIRTPQSLRNRLETIETRFPQITVGDLAEQAKTITPTASFEQVIKLIREHKKVACLPVLVDNFVVGQVSRHDVLELMTSPYTLDLYKKKKARDFMISNPITVDSRLSLEEAGHLIAKIEGDHVDSHFIIVNSNGFVGLGRTLNLLGKLTELQLQQARHANPLTQLPGNLVIDQTMNHWLTSGIEFRVAYLDLNHFKPFNDYYGYKAGDEVIIDLATIIKNLINTEQDFIGHIGGDDFVVLFRSSNWQEQCESILRMFDAAIVQHYDQQARADGGIHGTDRNGAKRFFPLLSLAIGVVHPDPSYITSYHDIAAIAADAKHCAKQSVNSQLFVSRRRKPHRMSSQPTRTLTCAAL